MADISENLAFAAFCDACGRGRDAARSLALLRSDEKWLQIARLLDGCNDKAATLFRMRSNGGN